MRTHFHGPRKIKQWNWTSKNSWHYLLRFEWIVTGASVKCRELCVCARASSFDRMRKITLHIWLIVLCRRVCLKYTGNNSLALARYLNVFRFHSFCSRSFTFRPSMPTACCLCDEWIVNVQLVHSQINCHYISFVMPLLLRVCTMWYHKSLWLWPLQSLAYCMRCAYHIHCKNFTQSNNKKKNLQPEQKKNWLEWIIYKMLHVRFISPDWWSCFNGHRMLIVVVLCALRFCGVMCLCVCVQNCSMKHSVSNRSQHVGRKLLAF